ncbi:MAG: hypothetical protein MK132_19335 [Lentisphaerales bacterium]|nr:hypothetical protein [Lentisphaerales bacterium]
MRYFLILLRTLSRRVAESHSYVWYSLFLFMSFSVFSNAKELEKIYPLRYQDYQKAKFEVDHEPAKNGMEGLWAKGESSRQPNEEFNRFLHPVNGRLHYISGMLRISKGRFFFDTAKQTYHLDDSYPRKRLSKQLLAYGINLHKTTSFKVRILGYWTYSRYSRKFQIAHLEDVKCL